MLRAQLARTSRELATETADMGRAVEDLNDLIRRTRRTSAKGKAGLLGGLVIGAALMYHLDPAQGRRRRAEIARAFRAATEPPLI